MGINIRLKTARKAAKYTQETMAKALGIPVGTYRNWEQGINEPSNDMIIEIVKILDTTSDYLFGRTESIQNEKYISLVNGNPKRRYLMDKIAKADDKKLKKIEKLMEIIDGDDSAE